MFTVDFLICAEGQQLNCFISLQYLIYDRGIINVLSKWEIRGFVSLSSIFLFSFLKSEIERHSKCVPYCLVICGYFK